MQWLTNGYVPQYLIGLGTVLAFAGAFLSTIQQDRATTEIARLNRRMVDELIGGDGFLFVSFAGYREDEPVRLSLLNHGKSPIYDVTVSSYDLSMFHRRNSNHQSFFEFEPSVQVVRPGGLVPIRHRFVLDGSHNAHAFQFDITARNGLVYQQALFARVDGKWKLATKVSRRRGQTWEWDELYRKVDEGFPVREGESQPNWGTIIVEEPASD